MIIDNFIMIMIIIIIFVVIETTVFQLLHKPLHKNDKLGGSPREISTDWETYN